MNLETENKTLGLRIALIGYGKMGKAIEQEALARGHIITAKIDLNNQADLTKLSSEQTDVAIEFTHPHSFQTNLETVIGLGIPIVSGTTGWYDKIASVKSWVDEQEGAFVYSSNFSVGVNILFKVNEYLAQLMNRYAQYDPFIEERHHRHKADAPSGTATSLAQQLLQALDRKTHIATDALQHRAPKDEELSVGYVRSGEIIGNHKVSYTSLVDTISIEHTAHNRRGFALGAVIAAEWIVGKKGMYEFRETL